MIDISIIIVTYNSAEDIKACLDSVLGETGTRKEVIVVDNNSSDETVNILHQYSSRIKIIYSTRNLGYAKANNAGFKKANGKYIFLLNPDAIVNYGALGKMFAFMERNKEIIALGPLVLNPDGSIQPSVRRFPNYTILFLELTGLSRIFPSSAIFNRWKMPGFDSSEIQEVEQPMASAFLLRKSFFNKEIMDEGFSMFFNDVDLCFRIYKEGGKIVFLPSASVVHKRGRSTGMAKERMIPLHTKGLLRFLWKHKKCFKDKFLFLLFLPWIMINTIMRILLLRFSNIDF